MGGSEFGVVSSEGLRGLMIINRQAAMEAATERSQRFTAIFRRSHIFEKTFRETLQRTNESVGVPQGIDVGLPDTYFDPHAEFTLEPSFVRPDAPETAPEQ